MKTTTSVVLAAVIVLSSAGVAVAADGRGSGHAAAGHGSAASERTRKFQKETLGLRDELAAKRVDLDAEYEKAEPDPARIASLRKEMSDLQGQIQAVADKYGVRTWARGHARNMMHGHDCDHGDWDDGRGCDCR